MAQAPAAAVWPVLERGVAELAEEPSPLRGGAGQVGNPQFDVVEGAGRRWEPRLVGGNTVARLFEDASAFESVWLFCKPFVVTVLAAWIKETPVSSVSSCCRD